ncbi:MAG TPA: hypothetical protein VFI13_11305 [Gemmatimonadales bacterium]|nr:hypothetical protein [Gemmatimonadales bacterium]
MNSASSGRTPFSPQRTILFGGVAVGTCDILWAFLMSALAGRGPVSVLQSVAGGFLGPATFQGGAATAFLGMFTHYFIATCWMTVYYLVSRRLPALARRPWVFGPLYGVLVYLMMYGVVLPLSAWHTHGPAFDLTMAKALFIHMFGIGTVAALVTRRGTALA